MLYKILGLSYEDSPVWDYHIFNWNYFYESIDITPVLYLEDKEGNLYKLLMWEEYGYDFGNSLSKNKYGYYQIKSVNKEALENIQCEVRDKSNGRDLIWIDKGGDIKNHLFTCVKYSGDSWYLEGGVKIQTNKWKGV